MKVIGRSQLTCSSVAGVREVTALLMMGMQGPRICIGRGRQSKGVSLLMISLISLGVLHGGTASSWVLRMRALGVLVFSLLYPEAGSLRRSSARNRMGRASSDIVSCLNEFMSRNLHLRVNCRARLGVLEFAMCSSRDEAKLLAPGEGKHF